MPEQMKSKAGFNMQVCTRCGGSGEYSFCHQYGTMCFKCQGTGKMFTKKGGKAYDFFLESQHKQMDEIKIGDYIYENKAWRKVTFIGESEEWMSKSDNKHYISIKTKYTHVHYPDYEGKLRSVRNQKELSELLSIALKKQ
ncbi:MAG: hypothetical protein GY834_10635 [Bacteroidetes bacterium]|nr:hypothetical protein [Bacteroidota bacterium]